MVPEAYRQRFWGHMKAQTCTLMEFACEKETLFDHWYVASKATDFINLRELMLMEFKAQAAVLADAFTLNHKCVYAYAGTESRVLYPLKHLQCTCRIPRRTESAITAIRWATSLLTA